MAIQQVFPQAQQGGAMGGAGNAGKSNWEKLMTQLLMAGKMNSKTLAGIALGNLLSGLLSRWKQNYDWRGDTKNEYGSLTPEERAQKLAERRAQDPLSADRIESFIKDRFGNDAFGSAQTPAAIQQTMSDAIPQAMTQEVSPAIRAAGQEFLNTGQQFLDGAGQQGLLGNAADWEQLQRQLMAGLGVR